MSKNNKNKLVPKIRFPEFENNSGWTEKAIGDKFKFKQGVQIPIESQSLVFKDGLVRFIRIIDVTNKKEPHRYIESPGNEHLIGVDDLFMIRYGTPGVVAIGYEGVIANNLFRLIWKESDNFVSRYWFYYLQKKEKTLLSLSGSSSMPAISFSTLESLNVQYPLDTNEQQKIAACLSSLDEVITAERQKLEVLKEHKKGLLQNLFPQEGETVPKVRFKEFEDSGEWVEKKLGEVADVSKLAGYEFTKHIVYEDRGRIIALRGLNIKNNKLDLSDVKYIDNSEFAKLNRSKLYVDDLMFTYIGTIGEVAIIDENDKYYLAPNVSRIRANKEEVNPQFLLQYFNVPVFKEKEISKYISSSSQPALTMENVRKFKISLPSKKEQEKIATTLSSIDELIIAQGQKLETLQQHKKGLLQGLFPIMQNDFYDENI